MANLLDGIKKLKERRQEVKQPPDAIDNKPDELSEMASLYSAIGVKSQEIMASSASDEGKAELERMEKSFSFRWDNLSKDQQKELVDRLLEAGLLPEKVRQVREMFNGKVVSLL